MKSNGDDMNSIKISQSLSPVPDFEWIHDTLTDMQSKKAYQSMVVLFDQLMSAYPNFYLLYLWRGNLRSQNLNDKQGAIADYKELERIWRASGEPNLADTAKGMIRQAELDILIDSQYNAL